MYPPKGGESCNDPNRYSIDHLKQIQWNCLYNNDHDNNSNSKNKKRISYVMQYNNRLPPPFSFMTHQELTSLSWILHYSPFSFVKKRGN